MQLRDLILGVVLFCATVLGTVVFLVVGFEPVVLTTPTSANLALFEGVQAGMRIDCVKAALGEPSMQSEQRGRDNQKNVYGWDVWDQVTLSVEVAADGRVVSKDVRVAARKTVPRFAIWLGK